MNKKKLHLRGKDSLGPDPYSNLQTVLPHPSIKQNIKLLVRLSTPDFSHVHKYSIYTRLMYITFTCMSGQSLLRVTSAFWFYFLCQGGGEGGGGWNPDFKTVAAPPTNPGVAPPTVHHQ